MRSKIAGLLIGLLAFAAVAEAAKLAGTSYQRMQRNLKLPTQVMLEHQSWAGPILASATYLKTSTAQSSTVALNITTFAHQPDFPRNITITPTGTTGNNGACTITVTGTDFYGAALTDATFSNAGASSTLLTGTYAFNTVSSVAFPGACSAGSGVTWEVGVGSALGLNRCTDQAGRYAFSVFNGAYETTRGTLVADTGAISGNTFTPNGTMNGSKVVDLYFLQDYSCAP